MVLDFNGTFIDCDYLDSALVNTQSGRDTISERRSTSIGVEFLKGPFHANVSQHSISRPDLKLTARSDE